MLLDVYGLKFIIRWFFFWVVLFPLCCVHALAPKLKAFFLFFFQSLRFKQNSRLISKVDKLFIKLVSSLCLFVGGFCGLVVLFFASAFYDLKQIDFLFSLWWW
jgi:hypothetical protein